jgi:glutamate-1-semialdehyde 2,1-aminomutase
MPPWGKIEQWLISVQHTDEDIDRFVANVRTLSDALVARGATQ